MPNGHGCCDICYPGLNSKFDETKKTILEEIKRLSAELKEPQSTVLNANSMKEDLQTKAKNSGLDEQTQRRLINNMQLQLKEKEENLRQYQLLAETTLARLKQQQLLGSAYADRAAEQGHGEPAEHVERLRKLYTEVKEAFDAKIVANWMYQHTGLTYGDKEQIQASQTMCDAAEKLLNILMKTTGEVFQCFLNALKKTNQEHVYSRIQCPDGTVKSEHGEVIRKHYLFLVDKIDAMCSSLFDHLLDCNVLTQREIDDIKALLISARMNEKLLSILHRKSAEQWELFLTALDKSGQPYIRKCIMKPTVLEKIEELNKQLGETERDMKAKLDATASDLELKTLKVKELEKKLAEAEERPMEREMKAKQEATAAGDNAKLTTDQGSDGGDKEATGKDVTEGHRDHTIRMPTTTEHKDPEN